MAESNLPTSIEISSQEGEEAAAECCVSTITLDDVMTNFGLKEFFGSLLVALAYFIDAQQSFISIFTDAQPLWHCTDHTTTTCTSERLQTSAVYQDLHGHGINLLTQQLYPNGNFNVQALSSLACLSPHSSLDASLEALFLLPWPIPPSTARTCY
ncbi:hypothetical protein PIB30_101822 [Stylosanthes scabra]|uniref:Uncharacterized protein n=1 Tax=Stylosanthes scabra TaxID=79078 RepID=A0ABU6ZW48_9FABA|nr:hypothetical protein [Stylosanthes scabra]